MTPLFWYPGLYVAAAILWAWVLAFWTEHGEEPRAPRKIRRRAA